MKHELKARQGFFYQITTEKKMELTSEGIINPQHGDTVLLREWVCHRVNIVEKCEYSGNEAEVVITSVNDYVEDGKVIADRKMISIELIPENWDGKLNIIPDKGKHELACLEVMREFNAEFKWEKQAQSINILDVLIARKKEEIGI